MIRRIRSERGDTILEVLIAITVLSMILVISLALSNRSSQGVRQSQERGEASRQTEGQLELLKKYLSDSAAANLVAPGEKFCMNPTTGKPTAAISSIPDTAQTEVTSRFAAFNTYPECKSTDTSPDNTYYSYIERGRSGQVPDQNTFTVHTRWYKVTGDGIDEATMVHKIYSDVASNNTGSVDGGGCPVVDQERNPFGNCVPCQTGWSNPIGSLTGCSPIPPRVRIVVNRIAPVAGAFNPTPACSTTGVPRAGVTTTLSGPGNPGSQPSTATYTVPVPNFSTVYTAGYTLPSGYLGCGTATQTVTTTPINTPLASNMRTVNFYIRPNCNIPRYQMQDLGSNQPVYGNVYVRSDWPHTGPDWGPNGPYLPWQGPPNPRYAIGDDKNGYPTQVYWGTFPNRSRFDQYQPGSQWYNRFNEVAIYNWQIVNWVWVPNWQNVLVGYNCPA